MFLTLHIDYPEELPDLLQKSRNDFEKDARMALAVKLFELKKISSGMAAKMVDMERVEFLLNLHNYGAAMIDLEPDELTSDLGNA